LLIHPEFSEQKPMSSFLLPVNIGFGNFPVDWPSGYSVFIDQLTLAILLVGLLFYPFPSVCQAFRASFFKEFLKPSELFVFQRALFSVSTRKAQLYAS
jgi:hypothetical protein